MIPSWFELPFNVVLTNDGSGKGTGTVSWIPTHAHLMVNYMTVNIVGQNNAVLVNQAQATIYKDFQPGTVLIDATFSGNNDASDSSWFLMKSQQLRAIWTGGDIGATATLFIAGWEFNNFSDLAMKPS